MQITKIGINLEKTSLNQKNRLLKQGKVYLLRVRGLIFFNGSYLYINNYYTINFIVFKV